VSALVIAVVALALAAGGARWYRAIRQDIVRSRIEREALGAAATLEQVIAHRMAVLHGLASFLRIYWGTPEVERRFDEFAAGLFVGTTGLRTLQYVSDGIIRHTWPLEGNESAIGRDLTADPRERLVADYRRVLVDRGIALSGPIDLYQGDVGLVGRLAVRDANDSVVAVAAAVINLRTLIEEAGLTRMGRDRALQLRDALDSLIWSSGSADAPLLTPVSMPVRLPDRTWRLHLAPMAGWEAGLADDMRSYWFAVLPLVVLMAGLAWTLQAWQRARMEATHLMAVRRAEDIFRQLFELVPDGVVVSRAADGVILAVNDAYVRLVQRTRAELVGRPIGEVGVWASPDERSRALRLIEATGDVSNFPFALRRQDGTDWRALLSARRIQLNDEDCNLAVVRDVHEQVELERRLAQSQRLEAVGRLAGGIAHDFNNLITGIRGYADLLLDGLGVDDPRRADLGEIQRAAGRAAELTRQLLTFARRQVVAPKVLDLNRSLLDAEALLRRLAGDGIVVRFLLAPAPVWVCIDPAQLEQVLTNLTVNARDAMATGGLLEIATRTEGHHAVLTVRDTGVGIPEEALPHLFEPFYTTKPEGMGTGLGLATVYGIVEQAEGRIEITSTVGGGTTVRIVLPSAEAPEDVHRVPPAPEPLPRGSETVLVVDDEPQIRELCVRLLGRLGYTVLAERDGRAALAALDRDPAIALVLTDMVMPGMGGWELVHLLLEREPRVRVVLMSGYSAELVASVRDDIPFLPKPFTARELAETVRVVLDG
jgi:PAS domain S-box-containing protein